MFLRFKSVLSRLFKSRLTHGGIAILDPAHTGLDHEPRRAQRPPDGFAFIHIFAAHFENEAAARRFCYDTPTKNTPEDITRELSGAFVDTAHVEVVFGNIAARLDDFMQDGDSLLVVGSLGSDNTVIIIAEDAFGGFPFVVHSTKTLTHLGRFTVPV